MAGVQHLRRRGGIFYARFRMPNRLLAISGRSEITKSLRTSDFHEAKRRLAAVWSLWEDLMEMMSAVRMDQAQIKSLLRDFAATVAWEHRANEVAAKLVSASDGHVAEHHSKLQRMVRSDIINGRSYWTAVALDEYLESRGLRLASDAALRNELHRGLRIVWLASMEESIEGQKALATLEITTPFPPTICPASEEKPDLEATKGPGAGQVEHHPHLLKELIQRYLRHRERGGMAGSWLTENRTALSWLAEWFGEDTDVTTITKPDISSYRDALMELPANWKKKLRGRSIREAAIEGRDSPLPKLEPQALQAKRLQPVHAFFAWCLAEGFTSSNPCDGITIKVSRSHRGRKRRDQFEIEDLQKIFSSPVFAGAKSSERWWEPGDHLIRDHRFWMPLLGLFTGARRGELFSLRTEDIIIREGHPCIYVREHFGDDGRKLTSVKVADSERLVPLHKTLIDLGFMNYVDYRRALGKGHLFDVDSDLTDDAFGKWFGRMLSRLEIKSTRNCFHSFRHSMEQAMRLAIDDFTVRVRITGRTAEHSSELYGAGHTVGTLAREINKVSYPGLDLGHVQPFKAVRS